MKNNLSKTLKQQIGNLRNLTEELQVQMALGKAEAKDLLEKEKKQFSNYLQKQKEKLANGETTKTTNNNQIVSSMEKLDRMLYQEIPVNSEGYDKYKNDTLKSIYEVEDNLRVGNQNHSQEVQENIEVFKNKMDAFRVNLALHDKENPEKVQNIKRNFSNRLEKVMVMINDENSSSEKLNNFSKDISESYNYLKKAISDLSK